MAEIDPYRYVRQEIETLVMIGLDDNPYFVPDLCPALTAEQIILLFGPGAASLIPVSLMVH